MCSMQPSPPEFNFHTTVAVLRGGTGKGSRHVALEGGMALIDCSDAVLGRSAENRGEPGLTQRRIWKGRDSNPRPRHYECRALTS